MYLALWTDVERLEISNPLVHCQTGLGSSRPLDGTRVRHRTQGECWRDYDREGDG